MTAVNINLLPWREAIKEEKKNEFLSILGGGVIFACGIVLFVHMFVSRQIQFQSQDNDFLKNEIVMLDKQLEEIKAIDQEKKQLLEKMKVIQSLQASRPEVVMLFDGIVRLIPQGLFLTALNRTNHIVQIDGQAESNTRVSALMRNIEASNLLFDPKLSLIQANEAQATGTSVSAAEQQERFIGFNLQASDIKPPPPAPVVPAAPPAPAPGTK